MQLLYGQGRDDKVAVFADDLSWGPIGEDLAERVRYFDEESPAPYSWDWLHEAHDEFWGEAAEPADERLVWVTPANASEYSAYLALLHRFAGMPAAVVRPDLHVPPHPTLGPTLSTGSLAIEEMADVLENAPRRDIRDDEHLSGRWAELQREAALLRVVRDGQLVSAPADHYDALILSSVRSEWTPHVRVVANGMSAALDRQTWVSSEFLFSRLPHLVASGAIEADGDVRERTDEGPCAKVNLRRTG